MDIERLRGETPGVATCVNLNNAGTALMPRPVIEAQRAHLQLEAEIGGQAAAEALIQGANAGDTKSAELATGYRWGEPHLADHVRAILAKAEADGDDRGAQLATRFLKAGAE